MARTEADSANEYSDNLDAVEPDIHNAVVDLTGFLPGPVGAVGAGLIDGEITSIETGNAKTALGRGGTTAAVGLAFGKLGKVVGGSLGRYLAGRLSSRAAAAVAGAESRMATAGVGPGGARMQRGFAMLGFSARRPDPLVPEIVTRLEAEYPELKGKILTQQPIPGGDNAIELPNAIIQVKDTARNTKVLKQVTRSMEHEARRGTNRPVILYRPQIRPQGIKAVHGVGGLATNDLETLIRVLRP